MSPRRHSGFQLNAYEIGPRCGCKDAAMIATAATPHATSPPRYSVSDPPLSPVHANASTTTPAKPASSSAIRAARDCTCPHATNAAASAAPSRIAVARVGAVVHARRVQRPVEPEHERGGGRGEDERRHEHCLRSPPLPPRQHADEHERPHQVELLLDREAPGVLEWRRRAEQRPVVVAGEHGLPVRDVPDRRERAVVNLIELVGLGEDDAVHRDPGEQPGQRRKEPAGAPGPEAAEPDRAPIARFHQEERGDQEAGQDEEQIHAEVSAGQVPAVEQQDAGYRRPPQTVQGSDVRDAHSPPGHERRILTWPARRRAPASSRRRLSNRCGSVDVTVGTVIRRVVA